MTNVGSLEFRILANHKHDSTIEEKALKSKELVPPSSRYRWAKLGETYTGTNPTSDPQGTSITDDSQRWVKNVLAGRTIYLSGKNSAGLEQADVAVQITGNTVNSIKLQKPHKLATVISYRIEFNPSRITAGNPVNPYPTDPIIREVKTDGHVERYVLYKLDKQNVTGELLAKAEAQQDDHYQPAVGFVFNFRPLAGAVRRVDPRSPPRGERELQISARDPPRQRRPVRAFDQPGNWRLGDHRGWAAGVLAQGARPADHRPPFRQPPREPEPRAAPGRERRPDPRR